MSTEQWRGSMCSTGCDWPWSAAGGQQGEMHPGGPIQVFNPLGQSRHRHHHHLQQQHIFPGVSQRGGAPAQEAGCTSISTSEEIRQPRLVKGQRVAQGPWCVSCVFGWRDLGAMEEQRREGQKLEDPEIVFPTSVTLMCFIVKVGAMLPSLLLSFFYLFCQSIMFQSLVKRH